MLMRKFIVRVWKGDAPIARGILFLPLFALSGLYRAGLSLRELCYATGIARAESSPVPVISVGNLSLGGTGKTPVTERLARELKAERLPAWDRDARVRQRQERRFCSRCA